MLNNFLLEFSFVGQPHMSNKWNRIIDDDLMIFIWRYIYLTLFSEPEMEFLTNVLIFVIPVIKEYTISGVFNSDNGSVSSEIIDVMFEGKVS